MISRSHRLSTQQFNEVIKSGKAFHSPLFLLRMAKAEGPTRIAAVAPVKIAKTAVARNAMRRRMYEAMSPHIKNLKDGFLIIVLAKTLHQPAVSPLTKGQNALKAKSEQKIKPKMLNVDLISKDLGALFVKAGIVR